MKRLLPVWCSEGCIVIKCTNGSPLQHLLLMQVSVTLLDAVFSLKVYISMYNIKF